MREHDAAGAYADVLGGSGGAGDEDFGRGAGEEIHGVVLGVPEAGVAESVDVPSERKGVREGVGWGEPGGDGGLVEDGEAKLLWLSRAHGDWMSEKEYGRGG